MRNRYAYYRNFRSRVWHIDNGNWVRTGKAACGQSIPHPSHTTVAGKPPKTLSLCKRCEKRTDA